MIPGFEKIIEKKIKEAQEKGAFKNLKGSGKPLPEDDIEIDPSLKIAYKILKNAGYLPPEIETKKQILKMEELLKNLTDEQKILKTQKKLNFLIKKYNILNNFSVKNELNEKYFQKITLHLNKN
ncbi:MAG: molecular chaperone DnaJ [Deltaproteobacteria bacterium]|nr:MAG: molecular chaperone DnaJ [Deltaproteobacteria bacterium]